MSKFPIYFDVEAEATAGIGSTWTGKSGDLPPITNAIPAEFGGPGNGYSPEDLFGLSVVNCIIATFKVYCEHSGAGFDNLKAKASVSMGKDPAENYLALNSIDITIDITGASDKDKVKSILEKAIKDCCISNSIKSGKTFHLNIS